MEGKCGMQIRVLLVTRSYADAIYMKNLLPWEQLGFQLLIELNSISGLQKVTDLHPQVLMLFGSLGAADLDLFLEYSQKENLRLYIIILPNKQHQVDEPVTETANSGTAHLYFVPKLTDGTLLKVLEDIRTTQLSAAPSSVISGSLLEDEKSSLAQLRQSGCGVRSSMAAFGCRFDFDAQADRERFKRSRPRGLAALAQMAAGYLPDPGLFGRGRRPGYDEVADERRFR